MSTKKILILIPARYKSSRFEGKPLALIHGKPMIRWVYENCKKLDLYDQDKYSFEVAVVTDDERIEKAVLAFGGKSLMVKDDVVSGTERINLAFERSFDSTFDLVINVQGDEPLIKPELLFDLVSFHLESDYDIATVVSKRTDKDKKEFLDHNIVKVAFNENLGHCHYFSRASIPFVRDEKLGSVPKAWFHHIGIYSYKPEALRTFCRAPIAYLEDLEKLEQLRAFEQGLNIGAIVTDLKLIGVDVKEDILKLEEVLCEG